MSATTTVLVSGMTCGHCVKAVTEELSALDGVQDVSVELVAGGNSTVTVTSDAPLETAAVRGAVDEAGYAVVEG
jgi:copper chaperone